MTGSAPPLRQSDAPPPRSPERDVLAAAIARLDATSEDLARIKAAESRFRLEILEPAQEAADAASASPAEERPNVSRRLAAAFLGEAQNATVLGDIEKSAAEAAAALDTAEKTWAGLKARLAEAESKFGVASDQHAVALSAVIASSPELAALIRRYEDCRREVARLSLVLGTIGVINMPRGYRWQVLHDYRDLSDADKQAWRAALDALKADADAELPH